VINEAPVLLQRKIVSGKIAPHQAFLQSLSTSGNFQTWQRQNGENFASIFSEILFIYFNNDVTAKEYK